MRFLLILSLSCELSASLSQASQEATRRATEVVAPDSALTRSSLDGSVRPTLARSHLLEGLPVSIGPDWKAAYGLDGVTFTPVLGKRAPRTHSVRFELLEVALGGQQLVGLNLRAAPQLVDESVRFVRSPDLIERYDALPAGLEQSFVFDSLPETTGALIVRGRLHTELPEMQRLADDVFRLTAPGIGGVRLEKVFGIDALGRRARGSLRRADDEIEIVLPADFVNAAEFPLVLDPLFSTTSFELADPTVDNGQIDVAAAGAPIGQYGFVHVRYYSAVDPDVTLVTTLGDGTAGLLPTAIETTINTFDQLPAIAYNRAADSFGIVWERRSAPGVLDGEIWCSSYSVSSSVVQPRILLDEGYTPDVGGDTFAGFTQIVAT